MPLFKASRIFQLFAILIIGNPIFRPVSCAYDRMVASMYTSYIYRIGLDPNTLHLLDSSCVGTVDGDLLVFNESLSNCGFVLVRRPTMSRLRSRYPFSMIIYVTAIHRGIWNVNVGNLFRLYSGHARLNTYLFIYLALGVQIRALFLKLSTILLITV